VPVLLMPVLVTVVVSPSANAAFYVAWMLAGFLYLIPSHLSTVLFAIAASEPQIIAQKLRFSLKISFAIGLPGMACLILGRHVALSVFGPSYVHSAALPLVLLVIGYIPMIPRTHYIAVHRAQGRISWAAAVLTVGAGLEVSAAVIGGRVDGLVGLSFALLVARLIEGLMTAPAIIGATMTTGRHRRADSALTDTRNEPISLEKINEPSMQNQKAGISALISMSDLATTIEFPAITSEFPAIAAKTTDSSLKADHDAQSSPALFRRPKKEAKKPKRP
jgi:hypothetical protein